MNQELLEKNWEWCQQYWERKSKQFKIQDWRFEKNNRKTSLGICNYTKKTISISTYFLRGESCDEKSMRNTILHEIAHALCGKSGHSEKWKQTALSIGCDGKVCGDMDKPPGKYLMCCPKGCFKREYYRKPKIDGRICLKCKSSPQLISLQ